MILIDRIYIEDRFIEQEFNVITNWKFMRYKSLSYMYIKYKRLLYMYYKYNKNYNIDFDRLIQVNGVSFYNVYRVTNENR